uniref:hypothetical protein n=1 Tax=uncultured Methanobrevibacter sp. TaxID=253161 RepID=UPI0025FE9D6C
DLSESQIESQINKVEADLKKYFYCPKCGKKTQISSAVIKRKRINTRVNIDNAAMPGWMKLKATSEFSYIRFCPKCSDSTDNIYIREYVKAYDGNAIVNNIESKNTKRDSGCMSLITTIVSILCISVWFICLILS